MTTPESRAVAAYTLAYGTAPATLWQAPGRVNLIGEHTDYNDGFVLPCAIDRRTAVACGPADDGLCHVVAADFDARDVFAPTVPMPHAGGWADYGRGVAAELIEAGHAVAPMRLAVAGDVPLGAGLSSSASLEVAVALALTSGALEPRAAALLCQRAENRFVGCACGIMDQLVSAAAVEGHALMIDCRTLERTPVVLPERTAIVVIDSGVRHANTDGGYNRRREECERAARHYGVAALRDLDERGLMADRPGLDDYAFRRARHVVTENTRVLAAVEALAAGDLATMGGLMAASHVSMRDDFEITTPEIDRIVAIADFVIAGRGGVRMTGGGFGGSVVALVPTDLVGPVREAVQRACRTPAGAAPTVSVFAAAGGAGQLSFTPGAL